MGFVFSRESHKEINDSSNVSSDMRREVPVWFGRAIQNVYFYLLFFLFNGFYSLFSFPFRILSFIRYLICPLGDYGSICLLGFPNDCVFLNSIRLLAPACVETAQLSTTGIIACYLLLFFFGSYF